MAYPLRKEDVTNATVLDALAVAGRAVEALMRRGFTVLSLEVDERLPRIWVQHGPLCAGMLSGLHMIKRPIDGNTEVFVSHFQGCKVQWRRPS